MEEERVKEFCEASAEGRLSAVRAFVEEGVFIDGEHFRRKNALHYAALEGRLSIVSYLVQSLAANVNETSLRGSTTPLMLASGAGHLSVVRFLIEVGQADVHMQDKFGVTVLTNAAREGHLQIVEYLVEIARAEVDHYDNIGWSALMWAASQGHLDIVKYLIEQGKAELLMIRKNEKPRLFIDWAYSMGKHSVVEFLLGSALGSTGQIQKLSDADLRRYRRHLSSSNNDRCTLLSGLFKQS